jgi:HSP20 family protein
MNQKSKVKGDQGRLKMTIIRWQPFQEIDALHRQMDRIFDDMLKVKRQPEMTWKPAVELQNTNDNLILRVQIPGVEAKDLDIQVAREAVAIAGEQRYENKGHIRSEFRYGKFQRVIPLPVAIQNDQVQAEYKNGILTLTLPKVAEARQKVVKINLADNTTEPVATTPTQEPQAA